MVKFVSRFGYKGTAILFGCSVPQISWVGVGELQHYGIATCLGLGLGLLDPPN